MNADRGPGLVEASRYIEAFRDKYVVIKLGGELLDGGPVLERILPQVIVLYRCGLRPVVVHGGGKQVDAACAARGIVPEKHGGRRVTSPAVMEVLLDIVAGELNQSIVDRLVAAGVPAVGFAAGCSEGVRCTLRPPTESPEGPIDGGRVGDVQHVQADPIGRHGEEGGWVIPVLPSVGQLEDGSYVNVNADSVAARVATGIHAEKLVLMTGVAGVMAEVTDAGPISLLNMTSAASLLDQGIAKGGMRAKLEEALFALRSGVSKVHILSGRENATLIREIFTDEGCGTVILPQEDA